jgi:hypothetical protein
LIPQKLTYFPLVGGSNVAAVQRNNFGVITIVITAVDFDSTCARQVYLPDWAIVVIVVGASYTGSILTTVLVKKKQKSDEVEKKLMIA